MQRRQQAELIWFTDRRGRTRVRFTTTKPRRGCGCGCLPGCGIVLLLLGAAILLPRRLRRLRSSRRS